MGITGDQRFARTAIKRLGHLFPALTKRSGFEKRRDRLADAIEALIATFAAQSPGWHDDLLLVDSTPVECALRRRSARFTVGRMPACRDTNRQAGARIALASLALCMGFGTAGCGGVSATSNGPATFHGDGFSIRLPGKPERADSSVLTLAGPSKFVTYFVESRAATTLIGYFRVPASAQAQTDMADGIRRAAASAAATLRSQRATSYEGFPARDARITDVHDATATLFMREITAHNRLYVLQYIDKQHHNRKKPPAAYAAFLSSLHIG